MSDWSHEALCLRWDQMSLTNAEEAGGDSIRLLQVKLSWFMPSLVKYDHIRLQRDSAPKGYTNHGVMEQAYAWDLYGHLI